MHRPELTSSPVLMGLFGLVGLAACGGGPGEAPPVAEPAGVAYVSDASCIECHAPEAQAWTGSQHDLAIQEPTEEAVLGDFDDAVFEHRGVTTRFRREGDAFVVTTPGRDGRVADFPVRYTFGVTPLQQYLLEGEGGRLQSLTVAWDSVRGEWFSLYPDEDVPPSDPLHWTGPYQTWNRMCAECHSTALDKGYDAEADTYHTTWKELDVGCQACHGPGEEHVAWAREQPGGTSYDPADTKGLTTLLRRGESALQIDSCAPCHARRTRIAEDSAPGSTFLDRFVPERLHAGLYFPDGQIQDEVYVYGSFVQSKMHRAGVACTDCHEPHSLKPLAEGNALCTQCHSLYAPVDRFPTLTQKSYDTPEHHFHPVDAEGARCVSCHMPTRTYMVVDPRRDHSFRIPRPDLSERIGTPNACNQCHNDKSASWAADMVTHWWGEREPDEPFALAFDAARRGSPEMASRLPAVALDPDMAPIVRATALELLAPFGAQAASFAQIALSDDDPLVRASAVRAVEEAPEQAKTVLLAPLLEDPVRLVRIEAARALVGTSADDPSSAAFSAAFAEWLEAQRLSADMPWSHLNVGRVAELRGDPAAAEASYRRALAIDSYFAPARFNLANLLNGAGRNREAEEVLRDGIERLPEEGEFFYSLGLLYAEQQRMPQATEYLRRAAELLPDRPRVQYNLGLAYQHMGQTAEAEQALRRALELAPAEPDFVHALSILKLQAEDWSEAEAYALQLIQLVPGAPGPQELLERIRTARDGG